MAKNDYFVVVYRILRYLLDCFMSGERAEKDMFGPDALGIPNGYWTNVMESIINEGYITGAACISSLEGASGIKLLNPKITQKGIEYLQENTIMQKAKNALKEFKEIIPGP